VRFLDQLRPFWGQPLGWVASAMPAITKQRITIEGHSISLSNLDKVLYPGERFTKARVIDYYIRIAPFVLPHLKNRPVTLKRFPAGVFGEFFYEKDAPSFTPQWVKTFLVPRKNQAEPDIRYILINNLATLVWLANLANLEIHPFLHRVPKLDRPTSMVFDCDPGEGADILSCARVAIMLRDVLNELGLDSYAKVSGSKGLQMYVPFNSAVTYGETGALAKGLAELLEEREPKLIVSQMPKRLRTKKVFIDWSQNAEFKTTVGVYSLRAKIHRPYVSVPIAWDELADALKNKNPEQLFFTPDEAIERAKRLGDLFQPVLTTVQKFPQQVRKYFERSHPRTRPSDSTLSPYISKRNFKKTDEPRPATVKQSRQGSRRRFVIQKHAASHLHYDFRLEMHGVLKSWSVPKGPPFKNGEKRLAMPTEDHPIEYLDFEGIIPQGQYGGGTVMVWDIGTYELIEGNFYEGVLHFYLTGAKLKGEWTVRRFLDAKDERDKRDKWQLVKTGKNARAVSKKRDDESALSKRTMAQIAKAADARWDSNRK
jgi:bifunctional non-homologous end joining protein LigD